MACAVELSASGIAVTVFEAAKVLGGRARRVEVDGRRLDNGLHILLGAYRETLRSIERVRPHQSPLGLRRLPLMLQVEPDFRLKVPRLPAPLHLAFALLTARGLTVRDKLRAASFLRTLRQSGFRCNPELTVSELLSLHSQLGRLTRYLWSPLCVSALNTRPEQASAQVFLNVLRDSLAGKSADSDLVLPELDLSAIFPERARTFIEAHGGEVRLGVAARDLTQVDSGFRVNGELAFGHVVVCVGPHRLESVLGSMNGLAPLLEQMRSYSYRSIYSVYLQYPGDVRLPAPMIGMSSGLGQWVFDRGALCGQAGLLGVVISGDGEHENLPHDSLAMRVHDELARRWQLPRPSWHQVIAEKRATFASTPRLYRPPTCTPVANLYLAGDYTESPYPATLESAVRSGVSAARLIAEARPGITETAHDSRRNGAALSAAG
jgi:squalene-associated FAD-dependent desaturase